MSDKPSEDQAKELTLPSVSIKCIELFNGVKIQLRENEKVIIVGPNNCGKSQFLFDVDQTIRQGPSKINKIVSDVSISKSCRSKELLEFLEKKGKETERGIIYKDWIIQKHLINNWDGDYLKKNLAHMFLKMLSTEVRLRICMQQESIGPQDQKTKPQHILYEDDKEMEKISNLFKDAFGKDLMFDFRGGKSLPIHVGNIPDRDNFPDRQDENYIKKVRDNPLLDKQGDGIKSYAGILFEAVVSKRDITLIDEPEAFLHPPQMRRLGETLSSEVDGQLLVATHSSDILRGFLEGSKGNIRILRIQRDGDTNSICEASSDVIKELWQTPVLRYSNALEGIFHEQTIICEDHSDCRLFNAISDHMSENSLETWKDTAYVPAGGKDQISKVAFVLRQVGIPVKAVFDIDFLNEKGKVKSAVQAFGGNWDDIEPLWNRLDGAVRDGIKCKKREEIINEINDILNSTPEKSLPSRKKIVRVIKEGSPWEKLKKDGKNALPNGQPTMQYNELEIKLR